MEQINGWSSATLGDGMWAPTVSAQIEKEFIAAFKAALAHCREAEDRLTRVMTKGGWLQ